MTPKTKANMTSDTLLKSLTINTQTVVHRLRLPT